MKKVLVLLGIAAAIGLWLLNPAFSYSVRGVDVSHHQDDIDWARFADGGVDFAYIKATEGGDWVDTRFEHNWEQAQEAGIPVGAYHFFTLCTPGVEQADNVNRVLSGRSGDLPLAIDLEFGGNCSARPAQGDFRTELNAFMDNVTEDRQLVIYTNKEFFDAYLADNPPPVLWWIRSLTNEPRFVDWTLWQIVPLPRDGVDGPVDRNVYIGSGLAGLDTK